MIASKRKNHNFVLDEKTKELHESILLMAKMIGYSVNENFETEYLKSTKRKSVPIVKVAYIFESNDGNNKTLVYRARGRDGVLIRVDYLHKNVYNVVSSTVTLTSIHLTLQKFLDSL